MTPRAPIAVQRQSRCQSEELNKVTPSSSGHFETGSWTLDSAHLTHRWRAGGRIGGPPGVCGAAPVGDMSDRQSPFKGLLTSAGIVVQRAGGAGR
jgi:hypothetical protein